MVQEFFNCTKHSKWLYRKCAKNWGSSLKFFFLKALEGVLHQWWKLSQTALVFVETSPQTYSLSEEGFGYNYGRLKSSASHASRENTLLRCGKISKWPRHLQRHRWARLIVLGRRAGTALCCVCLFIALFTTVVVGGGGRVYMILNIIAYISRNRLLRVLVR